MVHECLVPELFMSNSGVRNMILGRRELLSLVASLMALMALGIDILLPAFDDIRVAFGLAEDSSAPGQLITVYFIGLAVAQLFFGPLSDWYGRKPVIYVGVTIYIIGCIGSAIAPIFALFGGLVPQVLGSWLLPLSVIVMRVARWRKRCLR